ncbi:cytochrome biogenesis protein [Gammaproteobacteria bacterium]|nr:cytochrome biogenesis protein [Gammaproteobacteria bacterium]
MEYMLYSAAFMLALAGSGHCLAMCTPVLAILGMNSKLSRIQMAVFYNLGRISTYTIIGLFVGGLGQVLISQTGDLKVAQKVLRYAAATFMILIALQFMGLPKILAPLEKVGSYLWKYISPSARKLLPISSSKGAFLAGMLWGWLPCGMVYIALALSLTSGSMHQGAGVMLSFGLGTLPSMMAAAFAAGHLTIFMQKKWSKRIAGMLILAMTVFYLTTTGGGSMHKHESGTNMEMPTPEQMAEPAAPMHNHHDHDTTPMPAAMH